MSKLYFWIILSVVSISLTGCGTIKGVGEDLTTVGGWISQSSDHVKHQMKENPPGSRTQYEIHDDEYVDYMPYSDDAGVEINNAGNWSEGEMPNLKTDFLIDMSDETVE